jgi:MFS family permease
MTADPRAWRVVALLWLAYFINYVDRQVVFSIFPVLRSELGFTSVELGLIGSVFLWTYSLACPLAGRIADRFGRDRLIVSSVALWSAATLATGMSRSVAGVLFWRGMVGLTESLYFPAAASAIGSVHGGRTRSRAIALHGSAQFAGIAAGGWFGGWMAEAWGWRRGFMALAAAGVCYIPLLVFGLGRLPAPPRQEDAASGRSGALAARSYWALAAAFFVLCVLLWMLYAWLPSFVHERHGLGLAESGFTATVFLQAGSAAGILCGGALADSLIRRVRAGRFYVAAVGLVVCSPLAYAIVAAPSLALLKAASVGFGLFAGLMMSNTIAAAYDVIAPGHHGLAAGTLTLVGGLGGGIAVYSVGRWKDAFGVETLMACASAAGVLAAALFAAVVAARFAADRRRAGFGDRSERAGAA